ncbi:MAG: hypothetical protein ABIG45_10415 [Bacillota bacterium]
MDQLSNLREIAERNLGGLSADTRLLHRILHAETPKVKSGLKWRPILAAGAAAAVLLAAGFVALPRLTRYDGDIDVVTRSAGGELEPQAFQLTANVPAGSVSISETAGYAPDYYNLFAPEQNGNFPLVKVGNATYRLLLDAATVSAEGLGEQLGRVTDFTAEPALSSSAVISNIVEAGQPVYAVRGMKGAMAAATVQGALRVFQRVSFSGTAIVGNETLKDVLTGSVPVIALELSDVGTIGQADKAQELMNVLYLNAHYEGAAESNSRSQSLLIQLSNGLTVQMNAGSGALSACGTWSCPEFFDAFSEAAGR